MNELQLRYAICTSGSLLPGSCVLLTTVAGTLPVLADSSVPAGSFAQVGSSALLADSDACTSDAEWGANVASGSRFQICGRGVSHARKGCTCLALSALETSAHFNHRNSASLRRRTSLLSFAANDSATLNRYTFNDGCDCRCVAAGRSHGLAQAPQSRLSHKIRF